MLKARHARALDIGAGPLNDTRFLLQAGLSVDAIDRDPYTVSLASALNDPCLKVIHGDIREIPIAPNTYSLVVAIHVLPFLPRVDFPQIMSSMIDSLSKDGILCGTCLGLGDSWAQQRPTMTFFSRSELSPFFSELKQIVFSERHFDGADARDEPKHWHILRFIFRK